MPFILENQNLLDETTAKSVNVTGRNDHSILQQNAFWKIFIVLETLMLMSALYIFIAKAFQISRKLSQNSPRTRGTTQKFGNLLLFSVMLCSLVAFGKFSLAQVIAYSSPDELLCVMFAKANRAMHIVGFAFLAMFLWYRQRALYGIPQLKHRNTSCIIWWSRITLFAVVIATVAGLAATLSPLINEGRYVVQEGNCVSTSGGLSLPALSGVIMNVSIHGSLLLLFVRFILKQPIQCADGGEKLKRFVRRCTILSGICMLSDIVCLALVAILKSKVSELVTVLVIDADQFLNLLCILFCFSDWKKSLFPWARCLISKNEIPANEANIKTISKS